MRHLLKLSLFATTTLAAGLSPGIAPVASAAGDQNTPNQSQSSGGAALEEIVITAQKREETLVHVPIAVTALTQQTLEEERVRSVTDLSGLAPGLTVREATGSVGIPSFSMRGITSYGVVPGSDKETSIYLDGVYLGSTRGSVFDLPDVKRIEVLRGPQGTLFGRNATAGAISVVTRDPTGEFGGEQDLTFGDHDQFRTRTTVDLPAWGPLSAYVSFVHDERSGDIQNLGAGTVWNRTGPDTGEGVAISPKTLGDKDANTAFLAVKLDPIDELSITYKFDYSENHYTPEANAIIAFNPNPQQFGPAGAQLGSFLAGLISANNVPIDTNNKRPNAVNNWWVTPAYQENWGNSLTATYWVTDDISLKNIAAYRHLYNYANSQIDGLGGLVVAGSRFMVLPTQNQTESEQWSDELQGNYNSDWLHFTAGALWYHQSDRAGGPFNITNTPEFAFYPGNGDVPLGNEEIAYNQVTSKAIYAQGELHVTDQIDFVAGARETQDVKSGVFDFGGTFNPVSPNSRNGTITGVQSLVFKYNKTKPNYSLGMNYKPADDILLYVKYSTAFVSGGSIAGIGFSPETVWSWELGAKGEFLDRKLRATLALYTATYKDWQSAQSGAQVGHPELSTVILNGGDIAAKGVELEVDAAPVRHVTLGGSLAYGTKSISNVNSILLAANGGVYSPHSLLPTWTSNFNIRYVTDPLFQDAKLALRFDGTWHSPMLLDGNPYSYLAAPVFASAEYAPAAWNLNVRASIEDISIGPTTGEVAIWVRNLTDDQSRNFQIAVLDLFRSATFVPARSFGADLILKF